MTFSDIKQVSILSLFALLIFSLYFYLTGYKEEIPLYMEAMRILITAHYFGLIYLTFRGKLSINLLFYLLFLSFIFLSFVLRYWQLYETNTIYGGAVDSYGYITTVTRYRNYSLPEYWHKLMELNFNLDDLGFTTIMYLIAQPFGKDYLAIANALIVCNGIIYIIGVRCLYRLSNMLLHDDKRAVVATVLWAGFSFLITTSASGLKEVFFASFVIIAMYSIYRYKEHPTLYRLFCSILLIAITLFFRFSICSALVLSLLCIIVANDRNKRKLIIWAFIVILFMFPILTFVLPLITGGTTLEHVLMVTEARMNSASGSFLTKVFFPPLSLLFGPFPNLDRLDTVGFLYGYSLFLKDLLSIYFLSAFVWVIKGYKYRYYPLVVFIFCNMLMLIFAGVTLDIRYHITYIPFFFLICMFPYEFKWNVYKKYAVYICVFIVIFVYSNRSFTKSSIKVNRKLELRY